MALRIKILLVLLLVVPAAQYSETVSLDLSFAGKAAAETAYLEGGFADDVRASLLADGEFYNIDVNLSMSNDGKYNTHSPFQLGHYFYTTGSIVKLFFGGISFTAGRGIHSDVVDTPYSVYINPDAAPALYAQADYTGDIFSYQSRWVRLNERSAQTYNGVYNMDGVEGPDPLRDRGMTFKTYALDFGSLRIGFEDVSLYLDRSFDAESFLSPFPMFFLEMLTTSAGRPWSEVNNTNSLMGFFCDYNTQNLYLQGQILVDDINASMLAPVLGWAIGSLNNIENLSKVAWSLGGHYDAPFGRIGFFHGGALKYTFEATYVSVDSYSTLPYEYTYYPITEYICGSEYIPLDYTENYIGYKYGENNLAFLVDYSNRFFSGKPYVFDLYSSLEWVLNGSKSPSNPWHEHDSWLEISEPFDLLSDDVIEHILKIDVTLSKPFKNWLFTIDGTLGCVWNRLELVEVVPGEPKIYIPQSGNNHPIAAITLRAGYLLNISW